MQINSYSTATNYYKTNMLNSQKSMQHLASAKSINNAADNPAAIAILAGMQGQTNGLSQAYQNTRNSQSMFVASDGAMGDSAEVVQSMRTLSLQAANGTLTDEDRSFIQQEMNQLSSQVDYNANNTQFNGIYTNNGSLNNFVTQVGANSGQNIATSIGGVSSQNLGINTDVSTQQGAEVSIGGIDGAQQQLSTARSQVGSVTNGLEVSSSNVSQSSTNLQSAASRIGDSDMAREASLFNKTNVQSYASMMMLVKQMQNQKSNSLSLLA